MKEVNLPNTITNIGDYAFSGCTSLTNINIPDKITIIESHTFDSCTLLKSIELNNVVEIRGYAFYGCTNLKDIIWSHNITTIEYYAFSKCSNLTNIEFPSSLKTIKQAAFKETGLINITIPANITTLESNVFESCKSLKTANIDATITIFPDATFNYCTALTTVKFSSSSPIVYFEGSGKMAEFEPNYTGEGGNGIFKECTSLTEVILPPNLTNISCSCFGNCKSLKTIELPDTITLIGGTWGGSFYASGIESIKIPHRVTKISSETFGRSNLKEIYIPKTVQEIEKNAIYETVNGPITIYGYKGTAAESYAKEYDHNFIECTEVDSISITGEKTVKESNKISLNTTVVPDIAFNKKISWSSSNTNIATVDSKGVVTGKNAGTVNITALATDGTGNRAIYSITVTQAIPFKDVAKNAYYYSSVNFCYENKIISGTTQTTFSPSKQLTRGQLVTILWRMEGSKKINIQNKFPDVKEGEYYYDAVKWASSKGIVNGYSNGTFCPNANITREQLATILRNYANYCKKDISANVNLTNFKDYSGISDYARDGVSWAIAKKIISGKDNGTRVDPRGKASRAEAAVMITNYCNYIGR